MLQDIVSLPSFLIALLVFGFAPGALLRLIVLAFPRHDPRRRELPAELHAVPRIERPFWVLEQLEVALFEGIWGRIQWAATGRIIWRWHLDSGVERNREHPESFEIPDEESRLAVEPGDRVRLVFDMKRGPGEKMWVDVLSVGKKKLVGTLRNDPVFIPRLEFGDRIKFRHWHIVDIRWSDEITEGALAPDGSRDFMELP
jgi:hypothetical protein